MSLAELRIVMSVSTIKFSQFANGGALTSADTVVGLLTGVNTKFSVAGNAAFAWHAVTTNTTMVTNSGYITNSASQIQLTLPTTSAVGEELAISGLGTGGWILKQAAGQSITISPSTTTVGTGGSLASTNKSDSMRLVCTVANTTWNALGGPQGSLTII